MTIKFTAYYLNNGKFSEESYFVTNCNSTEEIDKIKSTVFTECPEVFFLEASVVNENVTYSS